MTGTIIPERLEKLNDITFSHGSHKSPDEGMCVMEAAAWIAGEEWTDSPLCVSPLLAAPCRLLNDAWDDEGRQRLKPFAARVIGTAGDGQDKDRSYLALDWLVRTHTPAWLDLAGLRDEAAELRAHRRIVDQETAAAPRESIESARQSASAAWDAAWDAAGDAAWAAAGYAAWDATWDAAWAAAGCAARSAAGHAAGDADRIAAWDAAGHAAGAAARAAAGHAAGYAARAALAPTVRHLQASVLDLLDRMIDPRASTAFHTDEEAKRLKAEREEKARRMHREVTLLFERDPIGRLIAAMLIAREGSDR